MIRRPPRSTQSRSSAASDVYKRQVPEPPRGRARPPVFDDHEIRFGYEGVDDTLRETIVEMDPPPSAAGVTDGRLEARWTLRLEPHECARIDLAVEPSIEGRRAPRLSFEAAGEHATGALRAWLDSCDGRRDCRRWVSRGPMPSSTRRIEELRPVHRRVVTAALRGLG